MTLRKIRLTLAVVALLLITALFLDFTGTLHAWFGWLAKIQFLPAMLALNVGVILCLLALTLVFGRIYCSVICPLGIFQDVVSAISGRRKKKKYRFGYSPAKRWLRYTVLALFVVAIITGIGSFVALLAPYSSYGRIVQNLFAPLYDWGNNGLAYLAERADSYDLYGKEVWMRSLPTFVIATVTFVVLIVLAWRGGRTYCNTICPVGTVLSFFAHFSWLKIHVDTTKCNQCGLCERSCKAACIDSKNHAVDYSRCVTCGNCIGVCHKGAISFGHPKGGVQPVAMAEAEPQPTSAEPVNKANLLNKENAGATEPPKTTNETIDTGRRTFVIGTAMTATTIALAQEQKKVDGGLAAIEDKIAPHRETPLTPPGSLSANNMTQHCTACQLCVTVCPNDVLRPSTRLMTLMQPTMSYERGYCRPECTKCGEVCPTGAIKPITRADKTAIQIGHAVWVRKNCIPLTDGVACGNCARHCPTMAISMVNSDPNDEQSPLIPVVNAERCIGCGACENLCPARPFSAIYVEGHEKHRIV